MRNPYQCMVPWRSWSSWRNLDLANKRRVYPACVLSALLHRSECWTLLKSQSRRLDAFHHSFLGISQTMSSGPVTSPQNYVSQKWGDKETITEKIAKRRWQWLSHLACMSDSRMPKKNLFRWLSQPRPKDRSRTGWEGMVWGCDNIGKHLGNCT